MPLVLNCRTCTLIYLLVFYLGLQIDISALSLRGESKLKKNEML
jgi:hypothetical protein